MKKRSRSEHMWGWIFILPTMIGLVVLNIIPIGQTIYQSFFKTGAFGKGNVFIGLDNYVKLFADKTVWWALWNTFRYAVMEVPASIIIALILAVLLNRKMRGKSIFRTIYFLPMVAAPAAISMVWRWLYNTEFGLINHMLGFFGVAPVSWLTDTKYSLGSVAIVGIWAIIGYNMILFLAGLQEIPRDYYEAAEIDGATGIKQFWNITLPLISPTMFFVVVTRVIASLQVFDTIYMMIDESSTALPKTQSLVYLFYKYSFTQANKGYGSAIVMVLLIVILLFTVFQMMAQKRWVHYN